MAPTAEEDKRKGSAPIENFLWYKGKSDVLREFRKSTVAILSAVASRNFSSMPGFAIEAFTDVEIDSKFKLTEYNQKLLGEAIDREFKALGLDNDISLKEATMAWELEKMQVLSDLQVELADLDRFRAVTGEALEQLVVEQEVRELIVLMCKAAIDIVAEDIKKQREEADAPLIEPKLALADAMLVTANRKLDVIPYIQAVLEAQKSALSTEAAIILPAREEKANYEKEVADVTTTEIIPLMAAKATATGALTVEQAELLDPTIEKAQMILALTEKQAELLEPMTRKSTAMTELTTRQHELLQPMLDKAAATEMLSTTQAGLLDPMIRKAEKTTEFIEKQTELLVPMVEKANKTLQVTVKQTELLPSMTRKATATEALTAELRTLLAPLLLKAAASSELAAEMTAQLANHKLLAQEKVTLAGEKVVRLTKELELMGKELTLEGKKITIEKNRAALELQRAEARLMVVDALRVQLGEIRTAMTTESAEEIIYINTQGSNEIAVKKSRLEHVETVKYEAQKSDIDIQAEVVRLKSLSTEEHELAMANATAAAHISEKLIHLLT